MEERHQVLSGIHPIPVGDPRPYADLILRTGVVRDAGPLRAAR